LADSLPNQILWNKDGAEMALIPAGIFEMGDHFSEGNAHELPVYTVTLDGFNCLHTWYYDPSILRV
jgi:formylglycine-generating enzyme required for sulfatase activity|tara:strand:+ start:613 stop:810 length:198 start_codon:yes stop_codon:yes gene_type:complete